MLINIVQYGVAQSAEMENLMTSAERVLQYTDLQEEAPMNKESDLTKGWPGAGKIKFSTVSAGYGSRDEEPGKQTAVLKNFSLTIEGGEKVCMIYTSKKSYPKSSLIFFYVDRHCGKDGGWQVHLAGCPLPND